MDLETVLTIPIVTQAFAVGTLTHYLKRILVIAKVNDRTWANLLVTLCPLILGVLWGLAGSIAEGDALTRVTHGVTVSGAVMVLWKVGHEGRAVFTRKEGNE